MARLSFADLEYEYRKKKIRKQRLPEEMEVVLPVRATYFPEWGWGTLAAVIHTVLVLVLVTVPMAMGQGRWDWSKVDITSYIDADGNSVKEWAGAETDGGPLLIWGSLDKPFLIVEGFDPRNDKNAHWYYEQATPFFLEARRATADILILNFADATTDMFENAAVVQRAVRYISSIKTGSTPIRLGGISMGGVIARYALAEAEENGDLWTCPIMFRWILPIRGPR